MAREWSISGTSYRSAKNDPNLRQRQRQRPGQPPETASSAELLARTRKASLPDCSRESGTQRPTSATARSIPATASSTDTRGSSTSERGRHIRHATSLVSAICNACTQLRLFSTYATIGREALDEQRRRCDVEHRAHGQQVRVHLALLVCRGARGARSRRRAAGTQLALVQAVHQAAGTRAPRARAWSRSGGGACVGLRLRLRLLLLLVEQLSLSVSLSRGLGCRRGRAGGDDRRRGRSGGLSVRMVAQ